MNLPTFSDPKILDLVFTHRSYLNESSDAPESNERLEFLGDSILSFIVSSYIYKTYPHYKEGELTSLRSVLTNTQTLFILARDLELGKHLKLSKGEEAGGGRESKSILANTFESLLGGIYVDQGFEAARAFVESTILNRIDEIVGDQGLKDAKSTLQERIQERHKVSPSYKIINEEGPDHAKVYTVGVYLNERLLAEGIGRSKQDAEKAAASNALTTLG